MQEQDDLSPANRELELALKSVRPAGGNVDAVAAAFVAGRRSARLDVRMWKAAAVMALCVGVGSRYVTFGERQARPSESHEAVVASGYSPPAAVSEQSVLWLQRAVGERGLAGLPAAPTPGVRAVRGKDFF